jgi:hypothetical protein
MLRFALGNQGAELGRSILGADCQVGTDCGNFQSEVNFLDMDARNTGIPLLVPDLCFAKSRVKKTRKVNLRFSR